MTPVQVIDAHTEGEPTRVVVAGAPAFAARSLTEIAAEFADRHRPFARGVLAEPRASDVWVGALLVPPERASSASGIVFFDAAGPLGMCGHGLIGVVKSLEHLGRLSAGRHQFDTPVGPVDAELLPDGRVRFQNVTSFVHLPDVTVPVPGVGPVTGAVAYGGNWFFVTASPEPIRLAAAARLTEYAKAVRAALADHGVTGRDSAPVHHVQLTGEPADERNSARNFVLCPSSAYDRSPCGTGTSARLALLAAQNRLAPGEPFYHEGVAGGVFTASYEPAADGVRPTITGRGWVMAEATLHFAEDDPFRFGLGDAVPG